MPLSDFLKCYTSIFTVCFIILNSDLAVYQKAFNSSRSGIAQGVTQNPIQCLVRTQDVVLIDGSFYNISDNRITFLKKGLYSVIVIYSSAITSDCVIETSYGAGSSDSNMNNTRFFKTGNINIRENYIVNAPANTYFIPQICNKTSGWTFNMSIVIRPLFAE